MSCKAILTAVHDIEETRNRLREWTDDDVEVLTDEAQNGKRPIITTRDCKECKEALEEGGVAEVEIEET